MKKLFVILCLFCISDTILSQEWSTDFESSKQKAKEEEKKTLLVFMGSDWCSHCIRLDKKVWQTEIFNSYAEKKLVLVKADFPRKNSNKLSPKQIEQNNKLASMYNPKGSFPLVVIFDSQGKLLGKINNSKTSPEDFIELLNTF